jgi:hypothetical protein
LAGFRTPFLLRRVGKSSGVESETSFCALGGIATIPPKDLFFKSSYHPSRWAPDDADATDTGVDTPVTTTNTFSNEFSLSTEPE